MMGLLILFRYLEYKIIKFYDFKSSDLYSKLVTAVVRNLKNRLGILKSGFNQHFDLYKKPFNQNLKTITFRSKNGHLDKKSYEIHFKILKTYKIDYMIFSDFMEQIANMGAFQRTRSNLQNLVTLQKLFVTYLREFQKKRSNKLFRNSKLISELFQWQNNSKISRNILRSRKV